MNTRSIAITTTFTAVVPADMTDDEIQDIGIHVDISNIMVRTFAAPIKGARITGYTTETVEPLENA